MSGLRRTSPTKCGKKIHLSRGFTHGMGVQQSNRTPLCQSCPLLRSTRRYQIGTRLQDWHREKLNREEVTRSSSKSLAVRPLHKMEPDRGQQLTASRSPSMPKVDITTGKGSSATFHLEPTTCAQARHCARSPETTSGPTPARRQSRNIQKSSRGSII